MSARFEWFAQPGFPELLRPGVEIAGEKLEGYALAIGNPDATTLILEGTREGLLMFANHIAAQIENDVEQDPEVPDDDRKW